LSVVIDMPFGLDELDGVFQVTDFLSNTEELLQDFYPDVAKFLVRKGFFHGPFLREYNKAFDDLIATLIKRQLTRHFNFTPEEMMILTDLSFLKLVAEPLFDQNNYKAKDGLQ